MKSNINYDTLRLPTPHKSYVVGIYKLVDQVKPWSLAYYGWITMYCKVIRRKTINYISRYVNGSPNYK